jgi:hypothetical protein
MRMKNKLACNCPNEVQAITRDERGVPADKAFRAILMLTVNLNLEHCVTLVVGIN